MNLEIRSFADVGDLLNERIVLKALTDLDVGGYAVFRSGVGTNGRTPTSGRKTAYWFPDEEVKANDLVVLYTKRGSRSAKPMEGGRTAYFFYWGKDEVLWNDDKFGAVLLEVSAWQFEVPGQL
jgi:hypothetical protein